MVRGKRIRGWGEGDRTVSDSPDRLSMQEKSIRGYAKPRKRKDKGVGMDVGRAILKSLGNGGLRGFAEPNDRTGEGRRHQAVPRGSPRRCGTTNRGRGGRGKTQELSEEKRRPV
eukprot:Gb_16432 [translate_table: standard]